MIRVPATVASLALGSLLSVAPASSRAQPTVRVRAETRIELGTSRDEHGVRVRGVLRDDLGAPLPGRSVTLRIEPHGTPSLTQVHPLRTDAEGAFGVPLELGLGRYHLRARYDGSGSHERAEVGRDLDLERADVRLRLAVADGGQLDLDRREHSIEVRARVSGDGGSAARLRLRLEDERGRALAEGLTDDAGHVRFVVASADLGPPGAGRIRALSSSDEERAEAMTEIPVVRFRATRLTLGASTDEVFDGDRLRLDGQLTDSHGPLDERAVGLYAGDEHLATLLTDGDGRFGHELEIVDQPEGTRLRFVARFQSDAPGRTSSESPATVVEVSGAARVPWASLLLPMVLCALLLWWLSRRAPTLAPRHTSPPAPPPIGLEAATRRGRRPERHDVSGRVLDHRDDEPIADAMVTLVGGAEARPIPVDDTGRFEAEALPAGRWTVRVQARGYRPSEAPIDVPHRGEWTDTRVRLQSLRALALAPFRRVVLRSLSSRRMWPVWTNREAVDEADVSLRDRHRLADATVLVEEACYGAEPPTQSDIDAIEQATAEPRDPAAPPST